MKTNKTNYPASLSFDMSWSTVLDELSHGVPHRDQIPHDLTKIIEGDLSSSDTPTQCSCNFQPGFLQSAPQTKDQEVDHICHIQTFKRLLIGEPEAMQKHVHVELPVLNEISVVDLVLAENTHKSRTTPMTRERQLA